MSMRKPNGTEVVLITPIEYSETKVDIHEKLDN